MYRATPSAGASQQCRRMHAAAAAAAAAVATAVPRIPQPLSAT